MNHRPIIIGLGIIRRMDGMTVKIVVYFHCCFIFSLFFVFRYFNFEVITVLMRPVAHVFNA